MNKKFIYISFILFFICLIGCGETDPFPAVKLPIYPNAINLHQMIDRPAKGAKSVVYSVSLDFPARELTDFYNKELEHVGFIPLPEKGIATFKWEAFNSESGNWEETTKIPARYTATWVDKKKTQRILLYIAYGPRKNIGSWEHAPLVSCSIVKYFDWKMNEEAFEKEFKK